MVGHIPWIIVGLLLALCGGWVTILFNEWDNNRRSQEAKREYERWRRRNQQ